MNEPLRIALVLNRMDSGGIEATVMNYYRHLDRSKVQFDCYYCEDSTFLQRKELEELGAGIYPIPPYTHVADYQRVLQIAFQERQYRIVHVHMNTMSVFPLFAAWRVGIPVRICHSHSTAHWGEGTRTLLKYLLRPFCTLFATEMFACGERAGRWMYGNRRFDQGKVQVIQNAINNETFAFCAEARAAIRKEFAIPEDAFVVGHVGRFVYPKNHSFLLDVFAHVLKKNPAARLMLVGEGELEQEIRAKVAELGIAQSVIFTGVRQDVARIYSAMDVFCLPSFYEGMILVGWEAQANGLPCLMSENISHEAVLSDASIQFPLSDAEKWAEQLLKMQRNPGVKAPDIRECALVLQQRYLELAQRH